MTQSMSCQGNKGQEAYRVVPGAQEAREVLAKQEAREVSAVQYAVTKTKEEL